MALLLGDTAHDPTAATTFGTNRLDQVAPALQYAPARVLKTPAPARVDGDDLVAIVARFASAGRLWRPHVRHDPSARRYVRLAWAPDHEVWLICWSQGHEVDLHDHGGSAGAFIVTDGVLREEYIDAGRFRRRRCTRGAARSFSAGHVHTVSNPGPTVATSIHAYSPPLRSMTFYAPLAGTDLLATHVEMVSKRESP